MSSLLLYFVSYYTIITTSFLAVTTNASDVLNKENNEKNINNNNNDKLIFKHPRPFSSSSSTSSRTLFSLQSMQDLTLQHDASIENLIDSYNNGGDAASGTGVSGRIDYNDWLSVVLDESMQFCSSSNSATTDKESKSKSKSNPCENGLYSSIVDGMRCAVSFRDDTVPYQELLLKYTNTISSSSSTSMIQDLVIKAQNELTSMKKMETFFSDWNEMINTSSSTDTLSKVEKTGLELGLIGAQKWVNDIFLNTDSPHSDSKLFNDGTSSCKPKRKLTEEEDEGNDDRLLSEIVVMNIFGGLYAATHAEAAYNEELATTNTDTEEEEDNTLDTELAYLISFVATGIPVMITKVV